MNSIRLFFSGDFCAKPSTSIISVSQELRDLIMSCDLKIVNFEVPLKPDVEMPTQHDERFYQHDDTPDFLRSLGFNLFSIATNHTFDWGEAGYQKTRSVLGDSAFGAGTYDEAYQVKVCDIKGVRVGFLALCYAAYRGVFEDVRKHDGLGCAYINDLKVNHIILEAKRNVDYLFVLPHDGIEYIDIPLPDTIARYRDLIDYGADGVIGTHPHCPQGWEEYKGKPIFYSLGNFFFNSKDDPSYRAWNRPHWYEGISVMMELSDNGCSYQVVNTLNEGNVGLSLDHSEARKEHNKRICNYLIDDKAYNEYLVSLYDELAYGHMMPMIDRTFHPSTLALCTKRLIKAWIQHFKKKDFTDDYVLRTFLRNSTRNKLLLRAMDYKAGSQL